MPEINIPGVSDKYKTNDLVKSLIEVEKIPLNREKDRLESFKTEQANWRRVNQHMSTLRESVRSLYSYDNPFNEKTASSTEPNAVTAEPGRDAALESFKIDVEKIASADRFLSNPVKKDDTVPAGTYTYTAGDKSVTFNWKGGKLTDFVTGLNRRGGSIVKASLIGLTDDTRALLVESLKTGSKNRLVFSGDAETYALDTGMIRKIKPEATEFGTDTASLKASSGLSPAHVTVKNGVISVPPESGFELQIPRKIQGDTSQKMEFSITTADVADVTVAENARLLEPVLPAPPDVQFKGITIANENSETTLPPAPPVEPREPVSDSGAVYLLFSDGSEKMLERLAPPGEEKTYTVPVSQYPDAVAIAIRNKNTGKELSVSTVKAYNENAALGFEPVQPVSTADDAHFKYEGIALTRPENSIDDVVPNVTLTLNDRTEKTATVSIKPDTETAKEALITFVGNYNRLLAELNILTQTKPEVITELTYFTDEEMKEAETRLGMFQTEFSLTNEKSTLQRILSASYSPFDGAPVKLLQQIGISTKSSTGGTAVNSSQLRGYLEIDEKKLDAALKDNIIDIKNLFGFDKNEDKIIDDGIAFLLDKNLQAYVQTGGILAVKNSGLDSKIRTSESQIKKLETQIASKESDLKRKYGQMQGTLNNLESQSTTISNFNRQGEN